MRISFQTVDEASHVALPYFGPEDDAYVRGLTHSGRRAQSCAARRALADALRDAGADLSDGLPVLCRTTSGAPSWGDPHTGPSSVAHLSLAHSDTLAAAVVASRRCGLDLERLDRPRMEGAWRRMATQREQAAWARVAPAHQAAFLVRAWTFKEAWAKLDGSGLAHVGRALEVLPHPLLVDACVVFAPRAVRAWSSHIDGHHVALLVEDEGSAADPQAMRPIGGPSRWSEVATVHGACVGVCIDTCSCGTSPDTRITR